MVLVLFLYILNLNQILFETVLNNSLSPGMCFFPTLIMYFLKTKLISAQHETVNCLIPQKEK
jgi:hypothetical protein